jgi:hypothetical protein
MSQMRVILREFYFDARKTELFNTSKSVKHLMPTRFTNKSDSKRNLRKRMIFLYAKEMTAKLVM